MEMRSVGVGVGVGVGGVGEQRVIEPLIPNEKLNKYLRELCEIDNQEINIEEEVRLALEDLIVDMIREISNLAAKTAKTKRSEVVTASDVACVFKAKYGIVIPGFPSGNIAVTQQQHSRSATGDILKKTAAVRRAEYSLNKDTNKY